MIRVLIQYPVEQGVAFDLAYYQGTHVALVRRVMTELGMIKGEWDEPVAHPASGERRYHVISVQYWETVEAMERAYASPTTHEVKEDVKKFYSGRPVCVISNMHSYRS